MIVVFGSINIDLAARVDALPRRGETIAAHTLRVSPGGKGANQALAARRAGADVVLVGCVGADAFAQPALALCAEAGVDLAHVARGEAPTGTALIHVDASGDNAITVAAGANAQARAAQVDDDLLDRAALIVLQLETPAGESLALAQRARRHGRRILLNAAPATALGRDWLAALDCLVVNALEAATLAPAFGTGPDAAAFARGVAAAHGIDVVVTLGGDGALAVTRDAAYRVAALPVSVVDTVGAGDAFVGALAAALDGGASLRRALAWGAAAGALACTGHGAQTALPQADAIARHAPSLESAIVTTRPNA